MYSEYNGMIVIVTFGADVILEKISMDKKDATRYSNEYYFGNINSQDKNLFKSGGKILRLKDANTYHMSNDDQIVTIIKTEPGYEYKFIISKHGSTSDINLEKFKQSKDMKGLEGVLGGAYSPGLNYVTKIENRKVEIVKAIEDITQFSKTKGPAKTLSCIDDPRQGCIYVLSSKQYMNLKKVPDERDKPITIYGKDDNHSDNVKNHRISKHIVKHRIVGKSGIFQTFELTDEIMSNIRNLTQGQIVTFIKENIDTIKQEDFSFFMKVSDTSGGGGSFIELNSIPDGTYNQLKLSFPELRRTFKLDNGILNSNNLPRCDYKIISPHDLIQNYIKLTDAYTGLITGSRQINNIDIYNSDEIKNVLNNSQTVYKLRQLIDPKNIEEKDMRNIRDILKKERGEDGSIESVDEIIRDNAKTGFLSGNIGKMLLFMAIAGAAHVGSKYFIGKGVDDVFNYMTGWNKEVYETIDDVSRTAGNIVNGQKEALSKLSPNDLSKLTSETVKTVVDSRPDIAYETMKHQTKALEGIKFAWEKIGYMLKEGEIPEGVKYLGETVPQVIEFGKDVVSSGKDVLMRPMNEAQEAVFATLEKITNNIVTSDSVFEFNNGGAVIKFMAKDIIGGSVDDKGVPIYSRIPGVMDSVINGFNGAIECTRNLTTTSMPDSSRQCMDQINAAYQNQNQKMASLGGGWWNSLTGFSLVQTTTIVLGVGTVGLFAGWLPAGWLVQLFAVRSSGMISRIGFHELKNLYETAAVMGIPILNELQQQIRNHPTQSARAFATAMGF